MDLLKRCVFVPLILIVALPHCSYGQEKVEVRRGFPYGGHYVRGAILPKGDDRVLNRQVLDFYGQWSKTYLKRISDDEMAVDAEDRGIISEGQGYGMCIVALMARVNANGIDTFNMLYNYYMAHRVRKRGTYLMRWELGKDKGSATDGDLDIAYALLLADNQWGSRGKVNYMQAALRILKDIREFEVDTVDWTLLSSNRVESDSKQDGYWEYRTMRVSDFMPSHLFAFRDATGSDDWLKIIQGTYRVFDKLQALPGSVGLVPDFVVNINGSPSPAPARFQGGEKHCDSYDYNACRVPWRLGAAYLLYGDTSAVRVLKIMNKWVKSKFVTGLDPGKIRDGYKLDGEPQNSKSDNLHLCYVAPFGVAAMINKDDDDGDWLNNIWAFLNSDLVSIAQYKASNTKGYYDNTIKMYTMIIMSGNYWRYQPAGYK